MTSDEDPHKVIPLVIRSEDGSQSSTLEDRFFDSGKPDANKIIIPMDSVEFAPLTESLIGQVNEYIDEWMRMDTRIVNLPDGTGGGGRQTWKKMALNASDRADRENRLSMCHFFEAVTSLAMAEENPELLRGYLVDVMGVSSLWISKLDSEKERRSSGIDFPSP